MANISFASLYSQFKGSGLANETSVTSSREQHPIAMLHKGGTADSI